MKDRKKAEIVEIKEGEKRYKIKFKCKNAIKFHNSSLIS